MLLIIAVILIVFALLRDQIIKTAVSTAARQVTGAEVEIGGFSMSLLKQSVRVTGFKMYNPAGFSRAVLVDLPLAAVDCDVPALFKGRLHLKKVEVSLKEVGLERNKEGKLNVDALKVAQQPAQPSKGGAQDKKSSQPLALQIDMLTLEAGKLVMRDYSAGPEPSVKAYDINFKKSYKDITSAQQLTALILVESMKQAGIKGAGIYGAALLSETGIIPASVITTFAGKDSVEQELKVPLNRAYDAALQALQGMGRIVGEKKDEGVITASVQGADVTVNLKQVSASTTKITVSARKYMLPKTEVANEVLYRIAEQSKK